jgi:hypothetical protein
MSGSRMRTKLLNAPRVLSPADVSHIARELPKDCPVKPLGMMPAEVPTAVFLSASGTIVKLSGQAMGQGNLEALFAPRNQMLWATWPRVSRDGTVNGVRSELARADLLAAAGTRGIWDEMEKVRGAGAWRADDGSLVLHLGDRVLTPEGIKPWGECAGYVYPAAAAMLGPAREAQPENGPAAELLGMLRTWNWRCGDIAPLLVLGWIAGAMVGGALHWRPSIWPTGDRGTGKSSLLELVKLVLGPNAAVLTNNTTAAGLRQVLGHKSLPLLLDELEAADDGGAAVAHVIELLRQASSGGVGLRGGADHKGVSFQIRSSMLPTSINVPPLLAQDRSRITVLELLPLPDGAVAPAMAPARMNLLGQQLLRRMADGWPALPERLEMWRAQLGAHLGLDARGQDQYGTLLACADLALYDTLPDHDAMAEITGERGGAAGLAKMLGDLSSDDVPDWRHCIDHMLSSKAEIYRGGDRKGLDRVVAEAAGRKPGTDADDANRGLATYGLRVVMERGQWWLAVANQHRELGNIFQETKWRGRGGTSGGWRQALLRAPGAMPRAASLRFEGLQSRVVLVPIEVCLNDDAAV